jgi:hypothetical protein
MAISYIDSTSIANTASLIAPGTITSAMLAPGAGGGAVANNTMYINNTLISSNYTLASNTNALSVGPITVATGNNVTVSSGSRWIVL